MKYTVKDFQIQILENDIVRIQKSKKLNFTDEPTLFVSRKVESKNEYKIIKGTWTLIFVGDYVIQFEEYDPLKTLVVLQNNVVIYKYKKIRNSGELPEPIKTPLVFPLMDSPRLVLPKNGYNVGSKFKVDNSVIDVYLLLCGGDFKKLRKQYISLTGMNEMPTIKHFGYWHSRYWEYSDKDFLNLIDDYKKNEIPLDVLVIDTDWRKSLGQIGAGYTVNDALFPDMKGFLAEVHNRKLETIFNDHPMQVSESIKHEFIKDEIKYRVQNLNKIFDLGLDAWWYDRNWYVALKSPSKRIAPETIGNYIYNDITERHLEKIKTTTYSKRPVTMTNINDIRNGVYLKILDSNSHRYTVQWSGDVNSFGSVIGEEIKNMNRCSNNMIGYYSSDIGGHLFDPSRDEYIRWQEYGAFSPIDRPHCCNISKPSREPWNYDAETLNIVRKYIDMRYRLANVLYTAGYKHVNNGLGITKPLSFIAPNDKKAYKFTDEFILGENILVAPVYGNSLIKLSKANYQNLSVTLNGKPTNLLNKGIISLLVDSDSKIQYNDTLQVKGNLVFEEDVDLYTTINSGMKLEIAGKDDYVTDVRCGSHPWFITSLKGNTPYAFTLTFTRRIERDYIDLFYASKTVQSKKKVYVPDGEWIDLNSGNLVVGPTFVSRQYGMEETPVFVKAGSLVPLYKNISNLTDMSLENVVYDYYPSRKYSVDDFFYEDDGITNAYLHGAKRINGYKTSFKGNKYIIEFDPSIDNLNDGLTTRQAMVKMHIRHGEQISSVLINSSEVNFKTHNKKSDSFYFDANETAHDSKTVTVTFEQDIKKKYILEFFIK